jgi:hypothetical protein
MSVSRAKLWVANEVLTASDLNDEFSNVYNNGEALAFPRTESADFNGQTLILSPDTLTTLRSSTDDEIDIAIGGTDTFQFTATELTILGKRVLTIRDKATFDSTMVRVGTAEARIASLESQGLLMAQLNNF